MLNKILFKDRGASLIMGMLLLFFISDGLNVILSHTNYFATFPISAHIKLSAITKGMAMVGIVSYFLWRKKYLRQIGLTLLLVSFFALVGIIFRDNTHLFTWLIRLFKLALPFALYYFIKDRSIPQRSYVFKLFTGLIFFQCMTVIAAFVFDWPVFLTFGSHRFGYSGFLIAQNEASFFYVIAFVFLWAQYNNTGHKLYVFSLVILLLVSALLGTKAIFILYASAAIYFVFTQKRVNKWLLLGGGFLVGSALFYGLYAKGFLGYYIAFLQETNWITMVTSFRNLLIQERLPAVFENWSWYNYLFGGVNPSTSFVEMDMIDMFTYGGVVGSTIYYWLLFKTLFKFKKNNYPGWFLVSQYFIIGGLAGHVFASGINAIYLALTCYYLQGAANSEQDSVIWKQVRGGI